MRITERRIERGYLSVDCGLPWAWDCGHLHAHEGEEDAGKEDELFDRAHVGDQVVPGEGDLERAAGEDQTMPRMMMSPPGMKVPKMTPKVLIQLGDLDAEEVGQRRSPEGDEDDGQGKG